MVAIGAAVVLAVFVLPSPWGMVLVASSILWEILEKSFWFLRSRRTPIAVGAEAMIGLPVDVVAACSPDGKVRFRSERWNATCSQGADVGDTVVIDAVERLTLIVSPRSGLAVDEARRRRGRRR